MPCSDAVYTSRLGLGKTTRARKEGKRDGGGERARDWDRGTNTDEKKSNRNLQLVELLIDSSAYFTLQLWQLRNNFVEEINQ